MVQDEEPIDISVFEGRRILVAEDNELNRELIDEMLGEYGLQLEMAHNGKEAINLYESKPAGYYDLIISDIQMPVMDGYALSHAIRLLDDKEKASIPILALTANAFEEDRQRIMDAQMNGHLTKPIDIAEVLAAIREVLE